MNWAQKRRLQYIIGVAVAFIILIGVPAIILLHQPATCFDGKQNQGELGIDCSGPCAKLCANEVQPVTQWQQTFQVVPGVYTAAAYIQNPNLQAESKNVPYTFTIYNSSNKVIAVRKGSTYIPAGRSFAVVEPGIQIQDTVPTRTIFEWDNRVLWTRASNTQDVQIKNQLLSDASTTPLINANIQNTSFATYPEVDVVAIVYDSKGNAFAASKTFVKNLDSNKIQPVVFTWPRPFPVVTEVCKAPTDVIVALDRSGSMASLGANPPEPLTSVKNAASAFIDRFTDTDKAGMVSFATEAQLDQPLSSNFSTIKSTINSLAIKQNGTQYTNISDAIATSMNEFSSSRHQAGSKEALVILTDGVATYPEKAGNDAYPSQSALEKAGAAKDQGIEIFTIGLGKIIDSNFLQNIATDKSHYYGALTTNDLTTVYSKVAESLCKTQAVRVELIATIPPQS